MFGKAEETAKMSEEFVFSDNVIVENAKRRTKNKRCGWWFRKKTEVKGNGG